MDTQAPNKRAFLLLRYALIVATAYMLLVEEEFSMPPLGAILLIVAALASNVIIAVQPARIVASNTFALGIILVDTLWITATLLQSDRFSAEFFFLYFFVLLLAGIGESLGMIAIGAAAVCVGYVYLMISSGSMLSFWSSPSLIRLPFLFIAAGFYGYLVDRTWNERRRADTREGERDRATQALQAKTEQLQEEAQISAAAAQVGRVLISSLNTPIILDRLCQVTTEVLACESSHTFLWQPEHGAYVPISSYGDTREQRKALRVVRISRDVSPQLLARLEREDVVQLKGSCTEGFLPDAAQNTSSVTLYMALRSGKEVVGIHTADFPNLPKPIAPRQERVARVIAQSASMALANARLVEKLENAKQHQADFFAAVSHELRTPLNQIIGYNELLLDGVFGELQTDQSDMLQRMQRSSRELLEVVESTIELSRLGTERAPIEGCPIDLAEMVEQVVEETEALRVKKDIQMQWRPRPNLPAVRTDAVKLKMVLKHLVDNAIKYTDRGGVTVAAGKRDGGVEISVSDTGIGIASDAQQMIFEPFSRVQGSRQESSGHGLGLYVVRRLIELIHGKVTVESEVGRGSTFRVWIPLDLRSRLPVRRTDSGALGASENVDGQPVPVGPAAETREAIRAAS